MSIIETENTKGSGQNTAYNALTLGCVESLVQRYSADILNILLKDRTTGRNIIWADDEYEVFGKGYQGDDEIKIELITGFRSGVIKPRIAKELKHQAARTRARAEVFTPSWLCNQMNNYLDEEWFGYKNVFNFEEENGWTPTSSSIEFPDIKSRDWKSYISSPRLEITCGEAPFICSRYDTSTGIPLSVEARIGFLDRKLRVAAENSDTYESWIKYAFEALRSTYGYEYQGDNLVLARINVLETVIDHALWYWNIEPTLEEIKKAAHIISWNLWQMDGISNLVPLDQPIRVEQLSLPGMVVTELEPFQPALFSLFDGEIIKEEQIEKKIPLCFIYNWEENIPETYASLKSRKGFAMKKFYAVITCYFLLIRRK